MSAEGIGAGILWKLGASIGAGVLGAGIMAAVEPPVDRKTLFKQAAVAGIGSMLFGPVAVRICGHFFEFLLLASAQGAAYFEVAVPIYFVVGALSWGIFGAISKIRTLLATRAADALAAKFGLPPEAKP